MRNHVAAWLLPGGAWPQDSVGAALPSPLVFALSFVALVGLAALALFGLQWSLRRKGGGRFENEFRDQLVLLFATLAAVLLIVLFLPLEKDTKHELLRLIGLLLSGALALSSTSFLGNMLAGLMLRALRSFRLGDFLRVGEHFGRVTERGLLHTEIQTEDSDLTTIPNLHLVTTPYVVVRAGGTIVSATVSLGYDVPRQQVEALLLAAAGEAELSKPFVHVLELGDYSVSYRVSGLLEKVGSLLSTRSRLRCRMLDQLHAARIEIASPTLMSTRAFAPEHGFLPSPSASQAPAASEVQGEELEQVAFEKAEQAASVEELGAKLDEARAQLAGVREAHKKATDEAERARLQVEIEARQRRLERTEALIATRKEELDRRGHEGG